MSFLSPFAFVLSILFPIVILMYLLKLRRTEQIVSSVYLWQNLVRDLEANAPWQRLRRNLLLLLQLLFLFVLIFALARPFTWVAGSSSQSTILVFDTSASMASKDINPNRLETAKEQARYLISNLTQDAHCTIITAGIETQVLISTSQDKRLLLQAIENIQPQNGASDMTSALELASAISARQPEAETVIYSDGKVNLPERLAFNGKIRFLPTGISGNNQAITRFLIEPGSSNNKLTSYIQVENYAAEPVSRRLILRADQILVDAQDLDIPAYGQMSVISEIIPKDTEVLEAVLAGEDALSLDDRAWTVQQASGNQNVTLVTNGNRFLETTLGLLPGINLTILGPEDLSREQNGTIFLNALIDENLSLIIFDNQAPINLDNQTPNILYLGPISSTNTFSITGTIQNPIPRPASDQDKLLDYVDLRGVSILDAKRIPLPNWAQPVLRDEKSGEVLLSTGEIEGQRIAVFAFDPSRSDLPLQVAYPILISNLVDWLLPGRIGEIPTQVKPGEVITFSPPPDITTLAVSRPDGSSIQLDNQNGHAVFFDTTQLGIYRVTWGGDQSLAFAVNLFDAQESDILPIQNLSLFNGSTSPVEDQPTQSQSEWWWPLTLIALIILVIEWLVYNRATLLKFRHQIIRKFEREM